MVMKVMQVMTVMMWLRWGVVVLVVVPKAAERKERRRKRRRMKRRRRKRRRRRRRRRGTNEGVEGLVNEDSPREVSTGMSVRTCFVSLSRGFYPPHFNPGTHGQEYGLHHLGRYWLPESYAYTPASPRKPPTYYRPREMTHTPKAPLAHQETVKILPTFWLRLSTRYVSQDSELG